MMVSWLAPVGFNLQVDWRIVGYKEDARRMDRIYKPVSMGQIGLDVKRGLFVKQILSQQIKKKKKEKLRTDHMKLLTDP